MFFPNKINRHVTVKTFNDDMERLLNLENNTALFQLSAARDKQFTFLLACGHVSLFGVQKSCLTHREQSKKGGTH